MGKTWPGELAAGGIRSSFGHCSIFKVKGAVSLMDLTSPPPAPRQERSGRLDGQPKVIPKVKPEGPIASSTISSLVSPSQDSTAELKRPTMLLTPYQESFPIHSNLPLKVRNAPVWVLTFLPAAHVTLVLTVW